MSNAPPSENWSESEQKFTWDDQRGQVAIALAHGKSKIEAAAEAGIARTTLYNWLAYPEFAAEVDRLSLMVGVAASAQRLRIINRLVRQKIRADGSIESKADIVDLLKLAAAETGGIVLDLGSAAILQSVDEQNTPSPTPPTDPESVSDSVS